MRDKIMEKQTVRIPNILPYYIIGVFWLIYALLFPLYRIMDFIIAGVISIVIFLLLQHFLPKKTKEIEVLHEEKSKDEYCNMILEQIYDYMKELQVEKGKLENTFLQSKIQKILELSDKMVSCILKDVNKARSIRKFVNYYFPTLLNLIRNYDALENEHVDSNDFKEGMKKVEEAVTTIETAFQKQYNALFEDTLMDIENEITVMEQMLVKDGYTHEKGGV